VHAVKYVFPPVRGSETRGVLAAWAAPPLSTEIADDSLPPVWHTRRAATAASRLNHCIPRSRISQARAETVVLPRLRAIADAG